MWKRIFVLFGLLALAAGCQSNKVETDYDTHADFTRLQRYQLQEKPENIEAQFEPLLSGRLKTALDQRLSAQFSPVADKPDFLVRYYVKKVEKVVDDRPRAGIGIGGFGSNVGGGISLSLPLGGNKFDQQAQIIVDFIDPASQQLLWRGNTVVDLSSSDPEANTQQVQKAVNEILKNYPPRS